MTERQNVGAHVRVPELMYRSLGCIKHPDRLKVFEALCSQGEATTKDVEFSTKLSLKEVNRSLRALEGVNLAQHLRKSPPIIKDALGKVPGRDMDEKFNLYSATAWGKDLWSFCARFSLEKANLEATLPEDVVESLAAMDEKDLNYMMNKFRGMYLLNATLISIYYQKDESATSRWLSNCLNGQLSKEGVEKLLADYTGRLVTQTPVDWSILDRALHRLGALLLGAARVNRWLSKASYTLTPKGKALAVKFAKDFHPSAFGLDAEYLLRAKIEADDGVLGLAIAERTALLIGFTGLSAYIWWNFFNVLQVAPSDSVRVTVSTISLILTFLTWPYYALFRVPNLLTRIAYWRKHRKPQGHTEEVKQREY